MVNLGPAFRHRERHRRIQKYVFPDAAEEIAVTTSPKARRALEQEVRPGGLTESLAATSACPTSKAVRPVDQCATQRRSDDGKSEPSMTASARCAG